VSDTQTLTIEELAQQVAVLQRREALRERGLSAAASHGDWQQAIQQRELREYFERRDRASYVALQREQARARVADARPKHEAALRSLRERQTRQVEQLERRARVAYDEGLRALRRERDERLAALAPRRAEIAAEFAPQIAEHEAQLEQLAGEVERAVREATTCPAPEIRLTEAQGRPAPRDAALVEAVDRDWYVDPATGKRVVGIRSEASVLREDANRTRRMLGDGK
jgi:predicted signal transduction protein with EAL and GGDEF domain